MPKSNPPTTTSSSSGGGGGTGLTLQKTYLITYNTTSLLLWATCTLRTLTLLLFSSTTTIPQIFTTVYPLLQITQSLALLEILHSIVGLVRAPVLTTTMQVASRILLVWGIMFPFQGVIVGGDGVVRVGDWAFLGCMSAWGVTEIIRYGFFALQVSGVGVPGVWGWLRYNTFYVLYPLGISSECIMVFKALGPAGEVSPLFKWFLVVVLGIYVPGSYILYTHMIAQRRKALKKK